MKLLERWIISSTSTKNPEFKIALLQFTRRIIMDKEVKKLADSVSMKTGGACKRSVRRETTINDLKLIARRLRVKRVPRCK